MSLRSLLTYAHENPEVRELIDASSNGGSERAFVSASLRPYLLAALLDASPDRPALVIAGDDGASRDLAAPLKQFPGRRPAPGRRASPRRAASATSRPSRRRRTSWACAWPRSTHSPTRPRSSWP